MESEDDTSYIDEESENYASDDYDDYEEYEEEGEYYDDDEYYEENGEYEEIYYEDEEEGEYYEEEEEWDNDIQHETLPEINIPKVTVQPSILIEDDPNDPRTWDEALRVFDESDSEDEGDQEELLKELKQAKIMENRKAILVDPFNLLKARQIVERLNSYKRKKLQQIKEDIEKGKEEKDINITAKEKEIEEYIETSFSPSGEDFNHEEYIAAIHGEASFEELKSGAMFLKANLQQNTIQLKKFVQNNIHRYVTCKDTIDVIGEQIQHNELSSDRGTGKLIGLHNKAEDISNNLFSPLFEHRFKAEDIRKKIGILEKYKYIFELPGSIKQSIERKEYDQILNDYKQIQIIKKDKQLSVFNPIVNTVEDLMLEYKDSLILSLNDTSISFVQHKKTMELLNIIGISEKPFWLFLSKRKDYIIKQITETTVNIPLDISIHMSQLSCTTIYNQIQSICKIFSNNVPEFYNLIVQFENEKNEINDNRDSFLLLEEIIRIFIILIEDTLTEPISSGNKKHKKKRTSKKSLTKIKDNIQNPRDCLKSLITCYNNTIQNTSIESHLIKLKTFIDTMIDKFFDQALKRMISQIKHLNKQIFINQIVEPSIILPSVEKIILYYIELWNPILSIIPKEKQTIKNRIALSGMDYFLKYLRKLIDLHFDGEDILSYEARLLAILEAIGGAITITDRFCLSCPVSTEEFTKKSIELEQMIIINFCNSKMNVFSVLFNDITWNKKSKRKTDIYVGDYIMNILLQLVLDHAQIYGITSRNSKDILTKLIEQILSCLFDIINSQKDKILKNNVKANQIYVDIMFMHRILQNYKSKKISGCMKQIMSIVQSGNTENNEEFDDYLSVAKLQTKILFVCFESP